MMQMQLRQWRIFEWEEKTVKINARIITNSELGKKLNVYENWRFSVCKENKFESY